VQVHVHDVDPDMAHVGIAHNRVQVRTVAVDKAAAGVHEFGDFLDVGLEQAKRVRVRDHDPGAVVIHQGGHVLNGQDAVGAERNLYRREAAQGGAGRIGAVRGVGDEHLGARVALRPVPCLNEHDAGQFAVRTGGRLEAARLKAGHGAQHLLGFVQHPQRALRIFGGEQRMRTGKAGQRGDLFVDLGVVFHGAGTERIHARVHTEVPRGKARVVAHHIQLSQVGQIQIRPHHAFRLIGGGGHVRFGQAHAHASGAAFFPQQGLVQYETRHPGPRLIAHQAISFRMASMSARLRVSVTQKR